MNSQENTASQTVTLAEGLSDPRYHDLLLLVMINHIHARSAGALATLLAKLPSEAVDWRTSHLGFVDFPLLHVAISCSSHETIDVLLAAGADLEQKNGFDYSALVWAMMNSRACIVDRLLQAGANPATPAVENYSALHFAVRWHQAELAARLISHGAPVNVINDHKKAPLFEAVNNKNVRLIKLLLSHGARLSSGGGESGYLVTAIGHMGKEVVLELVKAGIDPDGDFVAPGNRKTPLTSLVRTAPSDEPVGSDGYKEWENKILELAQLLLNAGADPDLPRFDGLTPFCAALSAGRPNVIALLVEHGAVPRANPDNLRCRNISCPECPDETPRRTVTERAEVAAMVRSLDPVVPLQAQCRLFIRKTMVSCRKQGESLISNVPKLPLPPRLQRYLCDVGGAAF